MENVANGCYLWGTLTVDYTVAALPQPEFVPFVSWDPDTERGEIEAFLSFWWWLTEMRSTAAVTGVRSPLRTSTPNRCSSTRGAPAWAR